MTGEDTPLGRIEISPRAIAAIAAQAATQSYGVVGVASKNLVDGIAAVLTHDPHRGVDVPLNGNEIQIDLYVIVEYGTRLSTVAASAANAVRFNVEKALGLPVGEINVHIQGLRVSNED